MDKDLLNKKIQNRYRGLLRVSKPLADKDEMRSIREAFHYAMDACDGKKLFTGNPVCSACRQVYSLVTDLYQPNPQRLRDWISIPKSNGYESLHTTVAGPGGRWVEVQIRTGRMNEIAEKGYATHWKYTG
ncbi:hypothetical protein ES705_45961 [subsurface metagenome]